MEDFYPLKFQEIYKEKIWGGKKLKEEFSRIIPSNKTGESWEITDNKSGVSIVKNGKFAGENINNLINKHKKEILGKELVDKKSFPLLVKFIDAKKKLSVQVHPTDEYAQKNSEENGKTEMWYVLSAKKGAKLIYGIDKSTNNKKLKKATINGRLNPYLKEMKVKKGDYIFIPAGTVHAIKGGILLAEIQQNSDTTYRLYDWDRKNKNGNSRNLHIDKAFEVINSVKDLNYKLQLKKDLYFSNKNYKLKILTASPYFLVEYINLKKEFNFNTKGEKFHIIINLGNELTVNSNSDSVKIKKGETILIPAALNQVSISGEGKFLRTFVPKNKNEIYNYLRSYNFNTNDINLIPGISMFNN
ncbi:MAG: type I phosphomannose isomerase catalytic subunit [Bacillota bacterium]